MSCEVPFAAWAAFCRAYRAKEGIEPNERDRFHRQLFEYFAAGWEASAAEASNQANVAAVCDGGTGS